MKTIGISLSNLQGIGPVYDVYSKVKSINPLWITTYAGGYNCTVPDVGNKKNGPIG